MVKIQRRLAKKKYLDGKYTYEYERFYIEIPKKYHEHVKWLVGRDLKMEVEKLDGRLVIVLSPPQVTSASRKSYIVRRTEH